MREYISISLVFLIVFFLLASILDVKAGVIAAGLSILYLVRVAGEDQKLRDKKSNFLDLSVIAGAYVFLGAAILASWVAKVKDIDWQKLDSGDRFSLFTDIFFLTVLIVVGILVIGLSKRVDRKPNEYFSAEAGEDDKK